MRAIAATQFGVVGRAQALSAGMTPRMIHHRCSSGVWRVEGKGVYALEGTPPSWRQQLMALQLRCGPGAVISHRSAAALWSLPGGSEETFDISSPRRALAPPPSVIHRIDVPTQHMRRRGALNVTDPTRTLCDIAAIAPWQIVEEALDAALHRGLTSLPYLKRRLAERGGKGVRGTAAIRKILELRDPNTAPSASVLESRFIALLRRYRLPLPQQQEVIRVDGRFIGRVDFIYVAHRVIVEADSFTHHSSRQAWEKDLRRRNELTLAGWSVLHVTWTQIVKHPRETAEKIGRALSLAVQLPLG